VGIFKEKTMPVPSGPLSPEDKQRMVENLREMLTAEGVTKDEQPLAIKAAIIFSRHLYALAKEISVIEGISLKQAERIAYLGLKMVLTQVKEYIKMEAS
jgi:hypothetical protein